MVRSPYYCIIPWSSAAGFAGLILIKEQFLWKYSNKMLIPDPTHSTFWVILVAREPEFSFHSNYVENLRRIRKWIIQSELERLV